jgi:hypothetical protein
MSVLRYTTGRSKYCSLECIREANYLGSLHSWCINSHANCRLRALTCRVSQGVFSGSLSSVVTELVYNSSEFEFLTHDSLSEIE